MPVLITDRERCVLRIGTNVLGGIGPDAIDVAALSVLPRVATITVSAGAPAMLQRLSPKVVVKLGGETLGAAARELHDGSEIEIGGFLLRYSAEEPVARRAAPGKPKASELATEVLPSVSPPGRPARLIELTTGKVIVVAAREMTVGRSEECDVVLSGKGLSRRHALIRAEGASYAVTDESTNGTFVNGERVVGRRSLKPGDLLAFGEVQYRFEFADNEVSAKRQSDATAVVSGVRSQAPALAELEITGGKKAGTIHRITREVCAIGRGKRNDVQIAHASVSASHASFMLKGDTWYLTDLHSANGSYVDGYRVAGERALSAGCSIRLGKVEMTFRPRGTAAPTTNGTQVVGDGIIRRLAKALSPPRD